MVLNNALAHAGAVLDNSLEIGSDFAIPDPQPLFRDIPEAEPFPMDTLGEFADTAKEVHRVIQAPDAICAQSILAGLTLAAQPYANVVIDGRVLPLSCFYVTIAESGERKSAVDTIATFPHRQHEERLERKYSEDYVQFEREHMAWKQSRDEGIKKAKTKSEKFNCLEGHGDEPQAPVHPVMLIEEPTLEAIHKTLDIGLPSIGLFSDEGGRLIGGHAMNSDNALKTVAGLSSLWDQGAAKRTRSGDGHTSLKGKRLALHLMMQPIVAEKMLGNEVFSGQGILSRTLTVWPESTTGSRSYTSEDLSQNPAVKRYLATCEVLLERELPVNEFNQLTPPQLELSPAAKQLYIAFHNHCDRKAGSGGEYEMIRGFANKAPEHAARIAGVFTVISNGSVVSLDAMKRAIELLTYYLNEAVRTTSKGAVNQELRDAEAILNWIKTKGYREVYPVLLYQKGPIKRLRKKQDAMRIAHILEEHGRLTPTDNIVIDGRNRREAWRVT